MTHFRATYDSPQGEGASSGSKASPQAPAGLGPSGYDPARSHCRDCLFYAAEYDNGWSDERVSYHGLCRRFPPVIDREWRTAPNNRRTQQLGTFPMVEADWKCGEFREGEA
jgi:hypothetical protein